ncbi:hypothetical protein PENSPDRAFT_746938 [Peniophora sp. CONT]|nr:hypothetical protein PENSPDRAFT_746938 [Peniophora sp. CONT]
MSRQHSANGRPAQSKKDILLGKLRSDPASALKELTVSVRASLPSHESDVRPEILRKPAPASIDALATYLERATEDRVDIQTTVIRLGPGFWDSALANDLYLVLVNLAGSVVFWMCDVSYRNRVFVCLKLLIHVWHGAASSRGAGILRSPPRAYLLQFAADLATLWEAAWTHRSEFKLEVDAPDRIDVGEILRATAERECVANIQQIAFATWLLLASIGEESAAQTLETSRFASVALWTWWSLPFGSLQPDNRGLDASLAIYLHGNNFSRKNELIENLIIQELGAGAVLSKLSQSFTELPGLSGELLGPSLTYLLVLSRVHPEMRRASSQISILAPMARALTEKRETPRGTISIAPVGVESTAFCQLRTWHPAARISESVAEGLGDGTRAPSTVDGKDVLTILIIGIVIGLEAFRNGQISELERLEEKEPTYHLTFSAWLSIIHRKNVPRKRIPESVIRSLQDAAKTRWYRPLLELRKAQYGTQSDGLLQFLLDTWVEIGDALKLDEEKLAKEYEKARSKYCFWRYCPSHVTPSGDKSFDTCKGCNSSVFYCSRSCQVKDWKHGGHKAVCKRVKPNSSRSA